MSDKSNLAKRLENLRENKGWTKTTVAKKLKLSNMATYANWEYGTREPDSKTLSDLASLYGVTVDFLLNGTSDNNKKYYELTEKEKSDIAIQADQLLEGIESGTDVNFYGEPATEEQKERLRVAIRTAMEMNKEEAKKKFTPKKYRDQ